MTKDGDRKASEGLPHFLRNYHQVSARKGVYPYYCFSHCYTSDLRTISKCSRLILGRGDGDLFRKGFRCRYYSSVRSTTGYMIILFTTLEIPIYCYFLMLYMIDQNHVSPSVGQIKR